MGLSTLVLLPLPANATNLALRLMALSEPSKEVPEYSVEVEVDNTLTLPRGPFPSPNTVVIFEEQNSGQIVGFSNPESIPGMEATITNTQKTKAQIKLGTVAEDTIVRFHVRLKNSECPGKIHIPKGDVSGGEPDPDPSNNSHVIEIRCSDAPEQHGYGGLGSALNLLLIFPDSDEE